MRRPHLQIWGQLGIAKINNLSSWWDLSPACTAMPTPWLPWQVRRSCTLPEVPCGTDSRMGKLMACFGKLARGREIPHHQNSALGRPLRPPESAADIWDPRMPGVCCCEFCCAAWSRAVTPWKAGENRSKDCNQPCSTAFAGVPYKNSCQFVLPDGAADAASGFSHVPTCREIQGASCGGVGSTSRRAVSGACMLLCTTLT